MKYLASLALTLCLALLVLPSFGQSKSRVCKPLPVIFENFQEGCLNIAAGIGASRNSVNGKNYFGFNGELRLDYFPKRYLEVGASLKPSLVNNIVSGQTTLFENSFYLRYYPYFAPCYKMAILTGVNIFRDGASYSVKGEPISKKKVYPSFNLGLVLVPKPVLQVEFSSDLFINRTARFNLGIIYNFKSLKLKKAAA